MNTLDVAMASDRRGRDFSIEDHNRNYRSSWVNIRLHLVFLISFLILIGFQTNLVLTESHSPGESNTIGSRSLEQNLPRTLDNTGIAPPDIFMDIGTFLIWIPQSNCLTLNVGSPPLSPRSI